MIDKDWMKGVRLAASLVEAATDPELSDSFRLNAHSYGCEQRNVVLEFLRRAESIGSDAVAGFCATLSDVIIDCGTTPSGLVDYAILQQRRAKRRERVL